MIFSAARVDSINLSRYLFEKLVRKSGIVAKAKIKFILSYMSPVEYK